MRNTIKTTKIQNSNLLRYYYKEIYRKEDYSESDTIRTDKTIGYLKDCGFSVTEIIQEIGRWSKACITIDDLSGILWSNSLIKRGAFYLHRELRIVSKAPEYDYESDTLKTYPFFCEMKIRYTADDVLNYFYSRIPSLNCQFVDKKTDRKTVAFLMNKYSNIDYIEPLDIILCSIDYCTKNNPDSYKLIDITCDNLNIIKQLQSDMVELESKDLRKITWR